MGYGLRVTGTVVQAILVARFRDLRACQGQSGGRHPPGWAGRRCKGVQCFLDAAGGRGFNALADDERPLELGFGVGGMSVVQVATAGSFQGPGLFEAVTDVARDR